MDSRRCNLRQAKNEDDPEGVALNELAMLVLIKYNKYCVSLINILLIHPFLYW
jgi:hypothetical protein